MNHETRRHDEQPHPPTKPHTMTEPIAYLNNGFVPASQAKLNIYDLGLVLGATLTEMTRTFRHQPFRAEDHVARLYRSLKYSEPPPTPGIRWEGSRGVEKGNSYQWKFLSVIPATQATPAHRAGLANGCDCGRRG